jgi:hypothetical protein
LSTPKRIQRKRTKGWRAPEGAVFVGRPTKWGNRWRIVPVNDPHFPFGDAADVLDADRNSIGRFQRYGLSPRTGAPYWATRKFESEVTPEFEAQAREELAGKDLMCWCREDQPCHADVLLRIANPGL